MFQLFKHGFLHRKDSDTEDNEKVSSLKEFKLSVAESLLKQGEKEENKRFRPSISVQAAHSANKKKGSAAPIPNRSISKNGSYH